MNVKQISLAILCFGLLYSSNAFSMRNTRSEQPNIDQLQTRITRLEESVTEKERNYLPFMENGREKEGLEQEIAEKKAEIHRLQEQLINMAQQYENLEEEESNASECPICCRHVTSGRHLEILPCGHDMCNECYDQTRNNGCPFCRQNNEQGFESTYNHLKRQSEKVLGALETLEEVNSSKSFYAFTQLIKEQISERFAQAKEVLVDMLGTSKAKTIKELYVNKEKFDSNTFNEIVYAILKTSYDALKQRLESQLKTIEYMQDYNPHIHSGKEKIKFNRE